MKTKYQKFDIRTVQRSIINEAPYNPRILREGAQKRLKKKMREVGLLSPLIWNEKTGNLVSGHQRLKQLDDLEGYPKKKEDYDLIVSVVILDEKTEKEMVVFFNNPSAQGEWNLDGLAELNLDHDIDFGEMGFSEADIDFMFDGDGRFSELFKDTEDVTETKEKLREIKKERKQAEEKLKKEDSADFYFVVICESQEEKFRVLKKIGQPKYEQYINAAHIEQLADDLKSLKNGS